MATHRSAALPSSIDVYLSCAAVDWPLANAVAELVRGKGFSVMLSQDPHGSSITIKDAHRRAKRAVVFLSRVAFDDRRATGERVQIFGSLGVRHRESILPVLLDDMATPMSMLGLPYVDGRTRRTKDIADAVGRFLNGEPPSTEFPGLDVDHIRARLEDVQRMADEEWKEESEIRVDPSKSSTARVARR